MTVLGELSVNISGKDDLSLVPALCGPAGTVASAAARLSVKTEFFGRVGDDQAGRRATASLKVAGVGIDGVVYDKSRSTTLSLQIGEGEAAYYRSDTAGPALCKFDLDGKVLKDTKILFFTSYPLASEPSRTAALYAAAMTGVNGGFIAYAPFYNPLVWRGRKIFRERICKPFLMSDIVFLTDFESELLFCGDDPAVRLFECGVKLAVIERDDKYSLYTRDFSLDYETLGGRSAREVFTAAFLSRVDTLTLPDEHSAFEYLKFSDRVRRAYIENGGGIAAMPGVLEAERLYSGDSGED